MRSDGDGNLKGDSSAKMNHNLVRLAKNAEIGRERKRKREMGNYSERERESEGQKGITLTHTSDLLF